MNREAEPSEVEASVVRRYFQVSPKSVIVGIDVGESFLHCAVLDVGQGRVDRRCLDLSRLDKDAVSGLADRIHESIPEIGGDGAVALVDSPRWPRDLDYSSRTLRPRPGAVAGRELDRKLRAEAKAAGVRVSMFPTPAHRSFIRFAAAANCKPHLRAFRRELFGEPEPALSCEALRGGALFTRFMLAGFACYRALEEVGLRLILESYPALLFKLFDAAGAARYKDKRRFRRDAVKRLRDRLGITCSCPARNLDQADAEIMALGAAASRGGQLCVLESHSEERFFPAIESRLLENFARLTNTQASGFKET